MCLRKFTLVAGAYIYKIIKIIIVLSLVEQMCSDESM